MRDDPRSHGLWEASAPPPPATAPLAGDVTADVAIVGGGFTGLSAALHLAEGGASVALLEGVEIGFGGSGRNVGLVNAGLWVMPDALPAVLGDVSRPAPARPARRWPAGGVRPRGAPRHRLRGRARRHAALRGRPQGLAEVAERARQWQARGAPVELLDAAETARRVGTTAYSGALLDRRAGTIQPLAYARGLAAAAIAAGARIFTESPVTAAEDEGDGLAHPHPGGTVRARWVIVATNAYTGAGAALARGPRGDRPPALFQPRHGAARRQSPPLDPARARRACGTRARS